MAQQMATAMLRGSSRGMAKLTPAQVRMIRRLWAQGKLTQGQIAEKFGVHQVSVSSVVTGRTWSDVN